MQSHCTLVFVDLFAFAVADKHNHVAGASGGLFPGAGVLTTTGMIFAASLGRY